MSKNQVDKRRSRYLGMSATVVLLLLAGVLFFKKCGVNDGAAGEESRYQVQDRVEVVDEDVKEVEETGLDTEVVAEAVTIENRAGTEEKPEAVVQEVQVADKVAKSVPEAEEQKDVPEDAAVEAESAADVAIEVESAAAVDAESAAAVEAESAAAVEAVGVAEEMAAFREDEAVAEVKAGFRRWSVGVNAGIPLFYGDMVTTAYDKTYIGIAAGIQGSYRFSEWLAASLSLDYASGSMGAREYSRSYLLSPDGMTYYVADTAIPTQSYESLYAKTNHINLGLSIDINLNRIFLKHVADNFFTVWLSPTIYGQWFSTRIYDKASGSRFDNGATTPKNLSLGLGGSVAMRFRLNEELDLQLKNSIVWNTDNRFDGITTKYDNEARHHAEWLPQIGVIWKIK